MASPLTPFHSSVTHSLPKEAWHGGNRMALKLTELNPMPLPNPRPWAHYWISQSLNFFIWKMGIMTHNKAIMVALVEKAMAPHSRLLPGKSHGQRSLVGCSPWGRQESDTTERLPFHFSLACIGEGNGNSLQCSCLENPRDGEPGGLPYMGSHRVGHNWSDLAAAVVKNLSTNSGDARFRSLSGEGLLEEGMVTHSSIIAWRIS